MSTQSKRLEDRLKGELEMARIGIICIEQGIDSSRPLDRLRHIAACIEQATAIQARIEKRDARKARAEHAKRDEWVTKALGVAPGETIRLDDVELDPAVASDVTVYGAGSV